jgi:hypothetical protein
MSLLVQAKSLRIDPSAALIVTERSGSTGQNCLRKSKNTNSEDDAMANLHVVIQGAEAEKAAEKLKAILSEPGEGESIAQIQSSELAEETRKVIDPLTLIGVILSIPSAVLASMDLVDRIRKRKRAQALIDKAKQVSIETGVQLSIVTMQGAARRLDNFTADELLDEAVKLNKLA